MRTPLTILRGLEKEKGKQKLGESEGLDDFQCSAQLGVNSGAKGIWGVVDDQIRLDTFAFDTLSLPRIPSGYRHSKDVSSGKLEVSSSENFTCGSRADECGESILLCEAGDHFRCAVCVFVDENNDPTMEGLWADPLGNKDHRAVPVVDLEA